jgi:PAS domain S-box-containing protein/putative nucleotidyltransferase with HDIG domain
VEQSTEIVFITDLNGTIEYVNPSFCNITGYTKEDALGKTPRILKSGVHDVKAYEALWATILAGNNLRGVVTNRKKNGDLYHQETTISPLRDGQGNITHFVSTGMDITERLQSEEESKNRFAELEVVNQISTALRAAQTLDEMLPLILDETLKILHASLGEIRLYDKIKGELVVSESFGYGEGIEDPFIQPLKPGEGIAGYVFSTGQPYVTDDYNTDLHLSETLRNLIPPGYGGVTVPIRAASNVIGTISLSVETPRGITESEIRLLTTISEIAGNAIQRTSLKQQTDRQLDQLTSLREIDQTIIASLDLKFVLHTILNQVILQLEVDAVDVLLFNPVSQTLNFTVGQGFQSHAIEYTRLRLGESHAGAAALERRIVHIPNLLEAGIPLFTPSLEDEMFISFYAVPLFVKGQIKGVMELFQRTSLDLDEEKLNFLNSLAGQAAIAIDNTSLFEDLQQSNTELSLAYDATIEGWSRALDLRDKETEGHTQRVTEMTIKLASTFGIKSDQLIHVRWGALLHDIGKMGIPDGILLKPGPLTEDEWKIMKKHPTYAFEMLSPIRYLHSAIDIPYCHHEKWDGSGYPRGLKGEQIPLSARIFAVVDVWDALSSDRPYRLAWPKEKIFTHIRSLSATHFDPEVLQTCMETGLLGNET